MSTFEVRAGGELRVAGRTLSGPALVYGDVSAQHRERFTAGAFAPLGDDVPLLLQHDPGTVIVPAGDYLLTDTERALEVRAELPEKAAALSLVRRRALTGFSVKFVPRQESRDGDIRVVERAELVEVSLVDQPSYDSSLAEIRRRGDRGGRLGTIFGRIPAGKVLECRCAGGDCTSAFFESGALDGALSPDRQRDLLAVVGDYKSAIASTRSDGVRFWSDGKGGLRAAVDVPSTTRGRDLWETMTGAEVPTYLRPVIDVLNSTAKKQGDVLRYSKVRTRALTLGATDASKGWAPVVPIAAREADEFEDQLRKGERRAADDVEDEVDRPPLRRRSLAWL